MFIMVIAFLILLIIINVINVLFFLFFLLTIIIRGKRLHTRNRKSEILLENTAEKPLDNSGGNPLKVTILWKYN